MQNNTRPPPAYGTHRRIATAVGDVAVCFGLGGGGEGGGIAGVVEAGLGVVVVVQGCVENGCDEGEGHGHPRARRPVGLVHGEGVLRGTRWARGSE